MFDNIRAMIDKFSVELDSVATLPFVGSIVKPIATFLDGIRKEIDTLDDAVKAASAASKK